MIANLLRRSPPESVVPDQAQESYDSNEGHNPDEDNNTAGSEGQRNIASTNIATEHTPLLGGLTSNGRQSIASDLEGQKIYTKSWFNGFTKVTHRFEERISHGLSAVFHPRQWDRKAMWNNVVVTPVSCLPAVAVGLLLNILDALSYGQL